MTISDRKLVTLIETAQLKACERLLKTLMHMRSPVIMIVIYSIALEHVEEELKARKTKKDCQGANPNSPVRSKHI